MRIIRSEANILSEYIIFEAGLIVPEIESIRILLINSYSSIDYRYSLI